TKELPPEEVFRQTAHTIAKINHINGKKTDAFMETLRGDRLDLSGLPFTLGDACRTKGERSKHFNQAVATVREALGGPRAANQIVFVESLIQASGSTTAAPSPPRTVPQVASAPVAAPAESASPGSFWERYNAAIAQQDKPVSRLDRAQQEHV